MLSNPIFFFLSIRYSLLKLFSSDQSRVQESWHTLVMKINNLSFATFQKTMQPHIDEVTIMEGDCSDGKTYEFFLKKVTCIYYCWCEYLMNIRNYELLLRAVSVAN